MPQAFQPPKNNIIIFLVILFFLGGKTCCAFDCTPNVDTAIEDKINKKLA